ncbi:uncharacterized protein SCHCODRAFT_02609965 [Schizophyllum commune H4-8]|uniref:uncharacterized protein n=1 Tax=Schizophyllum commune (strain H4-8 / FGSC 9210) TaxID=578458 RepID=UPI00215EBA23|nr:uncharacterized protein SCHCODRAFT_02609965 [Schizophyllum commune H4-8]KAI5897689.1 hypothetical protein SCHCODRAFT_02609965 [Schizophyllum commune H4-8]
MDNLVDEHPELALEMVKLLGNELKSVKTQLRELQSQRATSALSSNSADAGPTSVENAELRRRLRELQAENERLAESQGIVKQEAYDENDLLQQKAVIIDRQSEDLTRAYRDIQKLKKENEQLKENVASLQAAIDATKDRRANVEKVTASVRRQAEELQAELISLSERERALATEIQASKKPYTPAKFLEQSRRPSNSRQPAAASLKAYRQYMGSFRLGKVYRDLCRHEVAAFSAHEVLWPTSPADGLSRAVVIYPTHEGRMPITSASSVYTWTTQPASVGQAFELFYQGDQGWWLYTGVFECRAVVKTTLPALALGQEKSTTAKLADAVVERALDKNLVPPILFNNMKKMLKEGMLQVCCVELECVGFNRALYASLLSEAGGSASSVSSREPVGGRKRDQRNGEPSYRRREEKRRRTDNEQH